MTDHKIVKGTEKNGVCGVCGLQGDLTFMSCEEGQRARKFIEQKLREIGKCKTC